MATTRTYASPPGSWLAPDAAPQPITEGVDETTIIDLPDPPSIFPEGTSPTDLVDLACDEPTTDPRLIAIRVAAYRASARFLRRTIGHEASATALELHADVMEDGMVPDALDEFGASL